ncbi:pimeloyl-ACP methyl ester carboxylesterase [Streptomyces aurantiacus]|uniref:alpha/beta fold hydrolase n=1 Tax=Streptomyces aurantiacus TaxID=47760 RepID=UPI0027907525|nr:alpha/beta hydrolase [Streptomyces aurantiacus]MDQ0779614.1 pimeloyl-ACP methyl ester carboxylesterase [Streptomyces aurantiacus]
MPRPSEAPDGFSHAYADVNGVRLHYVIGGSGPVAVLLHGWPFTWIEWRALMPLLAEQGFTVIAPDLRGSGDSAVPAGHWTKRDEAEDLHRLLHHLGHRRAFVVGTDVGTMTAHAWAQTYPEDVTRLVLGEAFLPGYGLEEHMNPATGGSWHFGFHAQSELAAMLTRDKEESYLSGFWSMMSRGGITGADRAELLRAYTAPDAMRGGFEHYATLVEDGRTARAGKPVRMPVLVLNGEFGLPQQVLLDGARRAASDVRADTVPDAAHTFAADNPHGTAGRLTHFFTTEPVA